MSAKCGECGGNTVWDEDATSSICASCGTLTDPSQSILASHIDQPENTRQNGLFNINPTSGSTLKSFRRTRQGWDLAGQGKEARDNRNTYAIHDFIRNLSAALSVPGLSPRATNLFTQAIATGQFRWGRKARCLAGVCLAIALRESNRPDGINDIASILEESPSHLSRIFMSVLSLLHLNLSLADPTMHIPSLEARVHSIIQAPMASNLPPTLVKKLSVLHIPSVTRTLQSLSNMIYRLGESSEITTLPTGPTAAALLLLAMEAESRASLQNIGELAQNLASIFLLQGPVIMGRYRIIQDLIADYIQKLPWVEKPIPIRGRAKISKRTAVARTLQDVIQFHEDIWTQKLQEIQNKHPEFDKACFNSEHELPTASTSQQAGLAIDGVAEPRRKRRKLEASLDQAHRFLLDPVAFQLPYPLSRPSIDSEDDPPIPPGSCIPSPCAPPASPERASLMSYVLTVSPSADIKKAPSRLQLLTTSRGGESFVPDEELFTEAEWAQVLRTDGERQQVQAIWERTWLKEKDGENPCLHLNPEKPQWKGKRKCGTQDTSQGYSRINMEAYAELMGDLDISEASHNRADEVGEDDMVPYLRRSIGYSVVGALMDGPQDEGEIVVDDWRPLSPTSGFYLDDSYDEHYD